MMQVTLQTKGMPDIVCRFSDRQWAKIQGYMKRDGKRSFGRWLEALIAEDFQRIQEKKRKRHDRT